MKLTARNNSPLISIIVAVYNGHKTFQQCIDSISQQSYQNKEVLVIDGGSIDGTKDLIIANRKNLSYFISEPDNGVYDAWNKGLVRSKGEWICFLGADDYFLDRNCLQYIAHKLARLNQSINIAYGKIYVIDENCKKIRVLGEPWDSIKNKFKYKMCIPHPGSMHRKSLFDKYGLFNPLFRVAGDYEFLLRFLIHEKAFFMGNRVLVAMRNNGLSNDKKLMPLIIKEVRMAHKFNNVKGYNLIALFSFLKYGLKSALSLLNNTPQKNDI